MQVAASPPTRDSVWAWWERIAFAVLAIAAALPGLWLSYWAVIFVATAIPCHGTDRAADFAQAAFIGAISSFVWIQPWLASISFLRCAAGRRGLRARTWLITAFAVAALGSLAYVVALATEPPPSETCQPFVWN